MTREPSSVIATSRSAPLIVSAVCGTVAIRSRDTRAGADRAANHTLPPVIAAAITAVTASGSARRHSGGREVAASGMTRGCAAIDSSSARTSPMACQRRFWFLSRHRLIRSGNRGLTFGGSNATSGSRTSTEAITSAAVLPWNAWRPVSISSSTQPNEKMSLRWSAGSPFACSGDM